jgi:hypothetical protein
MKQLKYNFEYFCSPIWVNENQNSNDIFENINIDLLPISSNLKEEIIELDIIYQSTYNDEYPPEPKNLSTSKDLLFRKRIATSAEQLTNELVSKYKILFDKSEWENGLEDRNENPQI